jgi:integrase
MLVKNIPTLLSKITRETVGVNVATHLFRTAAASTAAAYLGDLPYVGSAILGHRDRRIAEKQYNRTSSLMATDVYGSLIELLSENE